MELSLKDFWPSQQHCDECLITEAETADVAVFLAVHQPMRLFRRRLNVQAEAEEKGEADLLEAVLDTNLPSGTLLVPIVGNSGVGKSHMIRWLDAQLRNLDDGVPRHIVRIPKSASLRRVLELILEGLPEKRYGTLRKQLTSARMPPDLLSATHGLREKLVIALERTYREAKARRLDGHERPDDRERMAHCESKYLPALLEDPAVKKHFMAYEGARRGVLARIAERYMQGAGTANQFTEDDLVLDETQERTVLAAQITQQYLRLLNLKAGQGRKAAVGVLNSVVDQALSELHDFGANSLTDLFVKMREHLLADGKELVLLVEDFAALAGIQGSLLDAMIREGIRDGQQQLCVMRTVLAVTEGYLANRETVLTRARYEWRIEEQPFDSEEEAITTFTNFVGGYLNAARWGKTRLARDFKDRQKDVNNLQGWLPNFYDQRQADIDTTSLADLKEFGFSPRGNHPLFPFSRSVIRQLALRHLRQGNAFVFNPRELLNLVLRETLLGNRPIYETSAFPPANFQQFKRNQLALPVERELTQRADPGLIDRLAALVYYWGDSPQSPGEAAGLPDGVYRAFALPPVRWSEAVAPVARLAKTVPGPSGESAKQREEPRDPWIEKLQKWREKGEISQGDANKVRQVLRDALMEWMDWEALLLKEEQFDHTNISLPKVRIGNPASGNVLAIAATDEDWEEPERAGRFYAALSAVIRFHLGKRTWNYEGGEADSAGYANLISGMAEHVKRRLKRQAHSFPRAGIRSLVQVQLIGALVLGVEGATSNVDADNFAAVFSAAPADDGTTADPNDPWGQLRTMARMHRSEAKDLLLKLIAARQGGGETVQAVDAAEILGAVRELRKTWLLPNDLNLQLFDGYPSVKEYIRRFRDRLKAAVEQRQNALKQWRSEIENWIGLDFEVNTVVEDLRKTALTAHQTQVFRCPGGTSYDGLRDAVNKLSECRLKETLEYARKSGEAEDFGVVLSAVAQADPRTEQLSRKILKQYELFLTATTAAADEHLATAPPSIIEEGQKRAHDVLAIEQLWQEIGEVK